MSDLEQRIHDNAVQWMDENPEKTDCMKVNDHDCRYTTRCIANGAHIDILEYDHKEQTFSIKYRVVKDGVKASFGMGNGAFADPDDIEWKQLQLNTIEQLGNS